LGIETSLPAVCSPFERGAHLWLIYQRQKSLSVPKDYGEYNAFDTKRKFVTGPNFHVRPISRSRADNKGNMKKAMY
jgi:hypothetical protein